MLTFASVGDFNAQMADMAYAGQLDAESGFTSGFEQAVIDDARIQNGASPQGNWGPYLVEDPLFQSVVNQDGRVRVAGKVWQVGIDNVYAAAATSTLPAPSRMADGDASNARVASTSAETYGIERASPAGSARMAGSDQNTFYFDSNNRRMRGRSWNTGWFLYQSAGAETVSERRKTFFGIAWWPNVAADQLTVTGKYASIECTPGVMAPAPGLPAQANLNLVGSNSKKQVRRFRFTIGGYNSQTKKFTAARKIGSSTDMTHTIKVGTVNGSVKSATSVACAG